MVVTNAPNLDNAHVEQTLSSFAELCRQTGLNAGKGNTKKANEKLLRRYLNWKKASERGNSIVITEIYQTPEPEALRSDDVYSEDILTCLRWNDMQRRKGFNVDSDREWNTLYPIADLLAICGFTSRRWTADPSKVKMEINELKRVHAVDASPEQAFFFVNRLNQHVYSHCVKMLDRSLQRLHRKGYISIYDMSLWVRCKNDDKARQAKVEEAELCRSIRRRVKEELGVKSEGLYNRYAIQREYSKALTEETPFTDSWEIREIVLPFSYDEVSKKDYLAARGRINRRSVDYLMRKADEDAASDKTREITQAQQDLDEACASDSDFRMLCKYLDYKPEDLLGMNFDIQMMLNENNRRALVGWFIEIGGAEMYIDWHDLEETEWREKYADKLVKIPQAPSVKELNTPEETS